MMGTILIFMDQQITAVIVNRRENKLVKGVGYHLDLFVCAIGIGFEFSFVFWLSKIPWFGIKNTIIFSGFRLEFRIFRQFPTTIRARSFRELECWKVNIISNQ